MDVELESFIDNKVYEIGGDLGCTLGYEIDHFKTERDEYSSLNNFYETRVFVTEIKNNFGTLVLKKPALLFTVESREEFIIELMVVEYENFNAERAAQEFFNSMGEE